MGVAEVTGVADAAGAVSCWTAIDTGLADAKGPFASIVGTLVSNFSTDPLTFGATDSSLTFASRIVLYRAAATAVPAKPIPSPIAIV